MTGLPVAHVLVENYRTWRAWYRIRYRVRCGVCGDQADGIVNELEALRVAGRHAAWHDVLSRILAAYGEP